jgi:hypothetical protein
MDGVRRCVGRWGVGASMQRPLLALEDEGGGGSWSGTWPGRFHEMKGRLEKTMPIGGVGLPERERVRAG